MSIFDNLLATAMMGESGGGGGGGSSDFSTATVTVVGRDDVNLNFSSIGIGPDGETIGATDWVDYYSTGQGVVVLYRGVAYGWVDAEPTSISGAIEYDAETYTYTITGDCTVTFA